MEETTKSVRLLDKSDEQNLRIVTLDIPWTCLHCDQPMGDTQAYSFAVGTKDFEIDTWESACGHKNLHADLIAKYGEDQSPYSGSPIRTVFENLAFMGGMYLREGQVALSEEINNAITNGEWVLEEAGTGTGKSNAYIVPILLQKGKKFLISTATKALQDQVFNKDIPNMIQALGIKREVVLYKGANNYLCLNRLEGQSIMSTEGAQEASLIMDWHKDNPSGDLNDYPEDITMGRYNISVDAESCNPRVCQHAGVCSWVRLREKIKSADVVVTNHYLTLLSADAKEGRFIIIDEGHEFPKIATNVLAIEISDRKIRDDLENIMKYNDAILSSVKLKQEYLLDWIGHLNAVGLRIAMAEKDHDKVLSPADLFSRVFIPDGIVEAISEYIAEKPMENLSIRLQRLLKFINFITVFNTGRQDLIRYIEKQDDNFVYRIALRYIAPELRSRFWANAETKGGVVLSATLRYNKYFNYMIEKLGMPETVKTAIHPSPFDYKEQSALLIPQDLPKLDDPDYRLKMSTFMKDLISTMNGRTLLLFTSYQRMADSYEDVANDIQFTCLMQGQQPISVLKEQFINDTHSVLFATKSFWTGIDVPGEALSCVYVDRIPFPQLGDPITKMTTDELTNALLQHLVPEAALDLSQGTGRLIRKETDIGLIVIGDERLISKKYSERILNTMPDMYRVDTLREAAQWLKSKKVLV